ncbi:MAG: NAD(P)H-quinone oxidoreductase [Hyphomicrobiaceae bacterium]|nr:NAD(P)H-quinone oxidoreductase [Hyphomicrobiaceae bacterium]
MTVLPQTMTAILIKGKGGPEVLTADTVATPAPGPGQVLVKVAAAGVNRPDVMQREGTYPAPKGHSEIPGLEVAGTIAALGSGATRFSLGDPVMALVNGGGYATYCVADEPSCLAVPAGLTMNEAAGVPETFFTVWHNVFERAHLAAGEWFMVHGGTSGIGVTAIQLAKAFGAKVIATAGSPEKCAACARLGADVVVNYREQDFLEVVKEATAKRGVDVILDMVGGDYIAKNIACLADDGRMVNIAYQKGAKAEVDFLRVMLKRLTITGSTLRIRPTEVKGRIARGLEEYVLPMLVDGRVKVVVDSTFALAEAGKAHARIDGGQHIGKIILTA